MAVLLAAVLAAAGVLALSNSPKSTAGNYDQASAPALKTALAADPGTNNNEAYIGEFKSGYADGFSAGVAGLSYPDESSMTVNSRGFLDGFSQGYTDGQSQQVSLRNQLCRTAGTAALASAPAVYGERYGRSGYARSSGASSGTLGDRVSSSSNDAYYTQREDRGIGSTARKALLIGGGAAAGAGLGGALGGKKGALIGALVGGGTGTALAVTKKPSRAFNRKVSKKSVLTKGLIGAGAGAVVGALVGGKRGALAGAALGGGGGALWGVLGGKRTTRRR